ncbi:MAG: hypothetical protein mread185_000118 [Mycoplasmataceae bacterium]|nr:MAG: hypothetical protein mread185_000118 [Mycoplasmataceae bacterium]
MTELIIIKTNEGIKVKSLLEKAHIDYEIRSIPGGQIYQPFQSSWEEQEKKALQEWENLSDDQLINEWESLPD